MGWFGELLLVAPFCSCCSLALSSHWPWAGGARRTSCWCPRWRAAEDPRNPPGPEQWAAAEHSHPGVHKNAQVTHTHKQESVKWGINDSARAVTGRYSLLPWLPACSTPLVSLLLLRHGKPTRHTIYPFTVTFQIAQCPWNKLVPVLSYFSLQDRGVYTLTSWGCFFVCFLVLTY